MSDTKCKRCGLEPATSPNLTLCGKCYGYPLNQVKSDITIPTGGGFGRGITASPRLGLYNADPIVVSPKPGTLGTSGGRLLVGVDMEPAASLEDRVPAGSRWRWLSQALNQSEFTVGALYANGIHSISYADGGKSRWSLGEILATATRIDEPAGAGTKPGFNELVDIEVAETQREIVRRVTAKMSAPKPAMPPGKCAPGCEPAKPCRIVIPVTDTGARYECPAWREPNVHQRKESAMCDAGAKGFDQAEARAMRSQAWEPRTPMVGRLRYDRRPR